MPREKERERILLCRSVFRQVFVVVKRNRKETDEPAISDLQVYRLNAAGKERR